MKLFGNGITKKEAKETAASNTEASKEKMQAENAQPAGTGTNVQKKRTSEGIRPWVALLTLVAGFFVGAFTQEKRLAGKLSISQFESISQAAGIVKNNAVEDYDSEKITQMLLSGLSAGLNDDYSRYYTAEELKQYNDQKDGVIEGGIGVTVAVTQVGIKITEVYEDSPAKNAGLKAGDIILSVDGKSTQGLSASELAELVSGQNGTKVALRVLRNGQEAVFEPVRAHITAPMVTHRKIDDITYIKYKSFHGNAVEKFREALDFAQSQGSKGIIIDLRDNLGGDLDIMAKTADMILPEGEIFYAMDKNGKRYSEKNSDADFVDLPIVILVNGYSASASEAFTGAARDFKRAVTVGTKTYGKGIMQTTYTLPNGGAFKLTTAKYYLPGGECIHKTGITPDCVVELPDGKASRDADMTDEQDTQLQKALELLKK